MDNFIQIISSYTGSTFFVPLMILGAFLAGLIASLSPCSLGMLPLIIGYVGGYSKEGGKKLLIQMISFSIGLSVLLSIIGVLCAISGRAFTSVASPKVLLLFASVIVILGLNLMGIIELRFPVLVKKMPQNKSGGLFLFPFLVGIFFGLAASPCASPLLASIMAIAAISNSVIFSIALFFAFALGQCVIIIIFAMFASMLKHLNAFSKYSEILMKISGVILILAGIYIYYAVFSSV